MLNFFIVRAHKVGYKAGHINRLGGNLYRITGKRILLNAVDIKVDTV